MPFGAIPTAEVLGIRRCSNGAVLSGDIAHEVNWINVLHNCLLDALKCFDICEIHKTKLVYITLLHPV